MTFPIAVSPSSVPQAVTQQPATERKGAPPAPPVQEEKRQTPPDPGRRAYDQYWRDQPQADATPPRRVPVNHKKT